MKKILVLVALTTALFSFEGYYNPYYNQDPDVENLYCIVLYYAIQGQGVQVNDRNRKQLGVDGYARFIKTKSLVYKLDNRKKRFIFSHIEYGGSEAEVYISRQTNSTIKIRRKSEYEYSLTGANTEAGTLIEYQCTTKP